MNPTVMIDLSGLNGQLLALQDALVGAGQDGDLSTVIKGEGRLLAMEVSTQLGPKEKARGEAKVYQAVKQTFAPGPETVFEASKRNGRGGDSGLTWLYAGPDFLVGVPMENLQPGLSATQAREQQRGLNQKVSGNAWTKIGRRGKQAVMKWNRIILNRAAFDRLVRDKNTRVGRMRATFAYAAHLLGQSRIPGWISRHFDKVAADGAALYDATKLNDRTAPALAFGSRVPGIENFQEQIDRAVDNRFAKLTVRIAGLIQNYSADWKAGRKISRKTRS